MKANQLLLKLSMLCNAFLLQTSIMFAQVASPSLELVQTARPIGNPYNGNGFWEYLPSNYGNGTLSPLIVFWHGLGENGSGNFTDLQKVLKNGPPKLISSNQWSTSRPFVVLSPQHSGSNCPTSNEIRNFITFASANYSVDPEKIYITGLSCGAIGMASYLATYGCQQVAAAVPIAGDASPIWNTLGCNFLNGVALWTFHGDADGTVSIAGDNKAMQKFIDCPQPRKDVKYTVYSGVGHDSWTKTYDLSAGNDIYTWMLVQTKSCAPTEIASNTDRVGNQIQLYPNPFHSTFNISFPNGTRFQDTRIQFYNIGGKEIKTIAIQQNETTIEKGEFQNGIYFYTISNNNEKIKHGKLIIQY